MKSEKNLVSSISNIQNWSDIKQFQAILEDKKPSSLRVVCLVHHSSKDGQTGYIKYFLSYCSGLPGEDCPLCL